MFCVLISGLLINGTHCKTVCVQCMEVAPTSVAPKPFIYDDSLAGIASVWDDVGASLGLGSPSAHEGIGL